MKLPPFAKSILKLGLLTSFGALFGFAAFARPETRWDLNDVSILLPLPKNEAEAETLFRLSTPSDGGKTLFPAHVHEEVVKSFPEAEQGRLRSLYRKWTAVSFRIDPCFRERLHEECERQIRVVWQPLQFVAGRASYENAALHTLYPLTAEEWSALVEDFRRLKARSPKKTQGVALGVHPGLVDGLGSAFAQEIHRRIHPWILQSRISRLALFLPLGNGEHSFKRFHLFEPSAKNRTIPLWISERSESPIEVRYGNARAKGERTSGFFSIASNKKNALRTQSTDDDLQVLLVDSKAFAKDRERLLEFAEIQRRVENPEKHGSLSVDCLTCHASGAAKAYLDRELGFFEKRRIEEPRFLAPGAYNLTNTSVEPKSLVRFRAFGYFGADVSILDRTTHESALVAESLNRASTSGEE
jgi:hypothetical protein